MKQKVQVKKKPKPNRVDKEVLRYLVSKSEIQAGLYKTKRRVFRTEAALESACRNLAKKARVISIKLNTKGPFGYAGWPDDAFLAPGGKIFFVEFKQPGKVPTPLQVQRIVELRKQGFTVYVIESFEVFAKTLTQNLGVQNIAAPEEKKKRMLGVARSNRKSGLRECELPWQDLEGAPSKLRTQVRPHKTGHVRIT